MSIRKSELVIVQTKWMKEAVEKKCFVSNVKQIYPEYYNTIYKAQYHITNDFFYPTSDVLYKNNNLLVEAARVLNKEGVNARISVTISGADDTIQYLGRISHEEVKKRYANSCLVFPSYIETFGYPLVEARKAGSIILASDCEFSHELLDGYENAYFFNPFDVKKLVDLMKRVAIGEIKRIDSSDGLINNCCDSTNSWQKVIDLIIDEMGNCNEYI